MTTSEIALIDTNILVYAADTTAEHYEASRDLRDRGIRGELPLAVSPQVLMEFFAVITNPRRVQQARSPEEARAEVEKYVRSPIRKIHPGIDILDRVLTLLAQHPNVSRQDIFDLFLAATMLENGLTRIYSYNQDHFTRFPELTVLTP
jgi:predicted nucleic acid-binding protein